MIKALTWFFAFALSLPWICTTVLGQTTSGHYQIDTASFRFSESGKKPLIILPNGKGIEIPRVWLYPPGEVEEGRNAYVNSFHYLEQVTAFVIGQERLGFHLSSWESMPPGTGSAMRAAGRDIFFVYNKKTQKIRPGMIGLGITKERGRSMGCFFSLFHDFIIGDINNDGLTDIGVIQEKIWCEEKSDEKREIDSMTGPYYKKHPIAWYVFRGDNWEKSSQFDGVLPSKAVIKLPMVGLIKSPIEFVREIYKDKLKERE